MIAAGLVVMEQGGFKNVAGTSGENTNYPDWVAPRGAACTAPAPSPQGRRPPLGGGAVPRAIQAHRWGSGLLGG